MPKQGKYPIRASDAIAGIYAIEAIKPHFNGKAVSLALEAIRPET